MIRRAQVFFGRLLMAHQWFVFYDDDYPGNGGIGLNKFDSQEEAAKFIQLRMADKEKPDISNYTVIKGAQQGIAEVSRVTEISISESPDT